MLSKTGDAYFGPMHNGVMEGKGAWRVYANGDIFKGGFTKG